MIYAILDELGSTTSGNEKKAILQKHAENKTLQAVFKMAYDPTINFWIKKIPEYTPQPFVALCGINHALQRLWPIMSRMVTGNAAVVTLTGILSDLNSRDAEVIEMIIGRDLKCGVTATTANKIWKNLIPEYPYMRCSLPKSVKLDTWNWKDGIFSQLKADGSYANLVYDMDYNVTIMTRSGTVYPNEKFADLVGEVQMHFIPGSATHGELLIRRDGKILPREIGNGILNSVAKGGSSMLEDDTIEFLVWDQIPLESSVANGKLDISYVNRYKLLKEQIDKCFLIQMIETRMVYSLEEAYQHYNELVADGFEGSIIKTQEGIWKDSTSKDQVKLKVDCCIDLAIVGFNAGKGKNEATFGSIQCVSCDGLFKVNVSGFSDEERLEISNNREKYMNTIMAVTINNIMKPSGNNPFYSAFLPRKTEMRTDKDVADSLEQIQDQFDSVIKGK